MKIRETIEGATENTVVYENNGGEIVSVSRPKIFTIEKIIAQIKAKEKKQSAQKAQPVEPPEAPEEEPKKEAETPAE